MLEKIQKRILNVGKNSEKIVDKVKSSEKKGKNCRRNEDEDIDRKK